MTCFFGEPELAGGATDVPQAQSRRREGKSKAGPPVQAGEEQGSEAAGKAEMLRITKPGLNWA